jgi:uncharacterized protein
LEMPHSISTGAKVNRIFLVGTLIEKGSEYWRGSVTDTTGSFTIYAGQYHPEAAHFLSTWKCLSSYQ